ncbi:MAG: RNA polymerase sigma factor [Chitinophagaceae bacterium]|nr:RNA polymerase sigma factor [Chitinophagaceae bacterium]
MSITRIQNEAELLMKVAQGDQRSFAQLFTAYHDGLYQFVVRVSGDKEMAREILLDVFTRAWIARNELPLLNSFTDWLFIVTRNQLIRAIRKRNTSKLKIVHFDDYPRSVTDDKSQENEYERIMLKAIEQLPPKQQQAFLLSRQAGFDNRTIAKQMGIKPGSVKKYLQWAQQSVMQFVKSNTAVIAFIIFLHSGK